jgi:hypothetical protein
VSEMEVLYVWKDEKGGDVRGPVRYTVEADAPDSAMVAFMKLGPWFVRGEVNRIRVEPSGSEYEVHVDHELGPWKVTRPDGAAVMSLADKAEKIAARNGGAA